MRPPGGVLAPGESVFATGIQISGNQKCPLCLVYLQKPPLILANDSVQVRGAPREQ